MPVAERREQLIEAALRVASRDGIDAATVRAVAAEAGVSLGVVHYCFVDKSELLRAVAGAITERNLATAIADVPMGIDLPSLFESAIGGLWEGIRTHRGDQLLSYELTTVSLRHADLSEVAMSQYRGSWAAVEVFLERIEECSSVTWTVPRADLARTLVALVDGFALAWLTDGDDQATLRGLKIVAAFLRSQSMAIDVAASGLRPPRGVGAAHSDGQTGTGLGASVHASSRA